jgi:serine/threonine-protein kinase
LTGPFDDPTIDPLAGVATRAGAAAPTPPAVRFTSGAIVGSRYRLVALLGKGGMGEVYRADDLTLDQPVALKFLAEGVAANDSRLAQFHNELRIARQVSHKNVCRLYDLGDADGRRFLTMEYVDGEDLSSSLRRFGRMPPDKAIQIARQLCAGVAAAHERGVLHRDLKPANVMLDGNGDVRITDFGIATAAADAGGGGVVGTPQCMAPELLAGKPASVKSDIYALGLILFEVFTGKRAYEAKTLGELKQLHDTGTVVTPSSLVHDLDPAVERVILRCLEKDPERRPASALTVAASLPGGDPLAAALAAGETPSPDMLVAAAETEALPVVKALGLTGGFLVVLFLAVVVMSRQSVTGLVPLDMPRDVLADRAERVIRTLQPQAIAVDHWHGFVAPQDHPRWEQQHGPADWWSRLRSGRRALLFLYRTSPREFVPNSPIGRMTFNNPPLDVSGMQQLSLDTQGRLLEYHSVPAQVADVSESPAAPPWPVLFSLAELDQSMFTPVTPRWTPRDFADVRSAWEGPLPERPDIRIRLEAASFQNRVVSFQIVWPWTQPARQQQPPSTTLQLVTNALNVAIVYGLLLVAIVIARHNVRANRADKRGAARLGLGLMITGLLMMVPAVQHSTTPGTEVNLIMGVVAQTMLIGGIVWILYLAIEPYARRFWPDGLLGWTRLLSGHVRDPRVGREVLIGLALAAAVLLVRLSRMLPVALGQRRPLPPFGLSVDTLAGTPLLLARWYAAINNAFISALLVAMLIVVLRLLFKRRWLWLTAGMLVLVVISDGGLALTGTWLERAAIVVTGALITVAVTEFGLIPLVVSSFVVDTVEVVPLTLNLSAWWATPTLMTLALLIGLAGFGFYASRAGQPIFGTVLKD